MTMDSRIAANTGSLTTVPYPVSAPEDTNWGQPSIIHLAQITPTTHLVAGIYAASDPLPHESELEIEFKAWEAASDKDFHNFEKCLSNAAG